MNTTEHNTLSVGQILLTSFYVLVFPILVLLLSGDWGQTSPASLVTL